VHQKKDRKVTSVPESQKLLLLVLLLYIQRLKGHYHKNAAGALYKQQCNISRLQSQQQLQLAQSCSVIAKDA